MDLQNIKTANSQNRYTAGEFDFTDNDLSQQEALKVYKVYKADHPLYYWLGTSTIYTQSAIYPVVSDAYFAETTRQTINAALEASIVSFYENADANDDDYLKALCYHDAIIDAADYSYDENGQPSENDWAHNVLGIFLAGSGDIKGAVCEGYSKAFQLLLNLSDINNVYVTGVGANNSGMEGHAWNLVEIDGDYYCFDLTWDDQPTNVRGKIYDYFCKTSEDFDSTHLANVSLSASGVTADKLYDLPTNISSVEYTCDKEIFSAFTLNGGEYVICGYKEIQLIKHTGLGKVGLSETVGYLGDDYSLVSIGTVYDNKDTLSNVFASGVTEITIPKTVDFIWDISFRSNTLQSIKVDENNMFFSDDDGVLYTKNKYTLVCYPAAKTGLSYTVCDGCEIIAIYAFENTKIKTLSLPTVITEFYIPNFGLGYFDSDKEYADCKERVDSLCANLNVNSKKTKLNAEEFKTETGINTLIYN